MEMRDITVTPLNMAMVDEVLSEDNEVLSPTSRAVAALRGGNSMKRIENPYSAYREVDDASKDRASLRR